MSVPPTLRRRHSRTPGARVAVCYGTRPQVIKASRLVSALRGRWEVVTVDTGQHYDWALHEGLYRELQVGAPSYLLGVGAAHPVEQAARIAAACGRVLSVCDPRVVVVIGDTNSTLACAIAATTLGIPVVHVEAGLRSGVADMAEERNRIAVDGLSRVLCAPSALAANTLRRERRAGTIVLTGDVSRDVLRHALGTAPARAAVPELPGTQFALVTLHRAELCDHADRLGRALGSLGRLPLPVVLPIHPRTASRIAEFGLAEAIPPNVRVVPPLGYLANLTAIHSATVVVTDSGGVQREAYWLGTPCVTLRAETEWPETVECGANRLVAPEDAPRDLARAVSGAIEGTRDWDRDAYGTGSAAESIADAIAPIIVSGRAREGAYATQ